LSEAVTHGWKRCSISTLVTQKNMLVPLKIFVPSGHTVRSGYRGKKFTEKIRMPTLKLSFIVACQLSNKTGTCSTRLETGTKLENVCEISKDKRTAPVPTAIGSKRKSDRWGLCGEVCTLSQIFCHWRQTVAVTVSFKLISSLLDPVSPWKSYMRAEQRVLVQEIWSSRGNGSMRMSGNRDSQPASTWRLHPDFGLTQD